MKKIVALLLTVLLFGLTACGTATKKPTRGTIDGDVYSSEYSGLKFTKPESWTYSTDEEIAAIMNVAADTLLVEEFSDTVEQMESVFDMMVVDYLTGSNVNITYENLARSASVGITEEQYLEKVKSQMDEVTTMSANFDDETTTVTLSGDKYLRATADVSANGVAMTQAYYIRKLDGYMISVVVTIVSGYEISEIEAMFS